MSLLLAGLATTSSNPGIPVWVAVVIVLAVITVAVLVTAAIRWRVGQIGKSTDVQVGADKARRRK